MIEIFSGLRSQIKNLKDRLKELDTSKKTQKEVKEVVDALNALEERYAKEKAKRDEKKKIKEIKNEKAPEETHEESKEAPKEAVATSESIPVSKESDEKQDIIDKVEKDPKIAPGIIKYNVDDKVMPVRGEKSIGTVLRHDSPNDLCYVLWDSGPLKENHVAGGYYQSDLKKYSEEVKPEHPCPCWEDQSAYCPKCKSQKTSDLKSNYEEMLKDLKDEYAEAVAKSDFPWISRLEQKIKEMEAKIAEKFGNEKQSDVIDHPSGTERLVTIDQTPPGDKANYGPDGKPSSSEYEDELAMPSGTNRNLNAKSTCPICQQEFDNWEDYKLHKLEHKTNIVKGPIKTSALKINVFNRDWHVEPVKKDASIGYDVLDNTGKKVMHIKPANGKEWTEAEIKAALHHELTFGFKQAKLVDKIAFLNEGTKVIVLATSKDKKQVKVANLEHSVRAWVPSTKIKLLALEGQSVAHGSHMDKVLAIHETESLIECPIKGVHWEKKEVKLPTHDKPVIQPPATPESLHEEALKTQLPPVIPNERGYLNNPPVDKQADEEYEDIQPQEDDIFIQDSRDGGEDAFEDGKVIAHRSVDQEHEEFYQAIMMHMQSGNIFPSVWVVSDHGNVHEATSFYEYAAGQHGWEKTSALNKQARVVHRSDGWHVLSEKGKNLGGPYKTEEEANKRLRQVEFFKHHGSQKPFSKKAAEVLTDPYSALQTQVQTLRDRMSLVQERLQSNPLPKEAGNGEKDNSEMDIPTLLEDLTMGIDLLETKLQGDKVEEDVHPAIEEMENLLWSVEEKLGITPKLSPEEKAEPEHAEIVKELDKASAKKECKDSSGTSHAGPITEYYGKGSNKPEYYCDKHVPSEPKHKKEATTTPTSPVSPSSPALPGTSTSAPATPTDADKPTCALCGGMQFADFAKYQNHMEYSHASDTMPTSPSQKNLPTTVGSKKKAADVTLTDESIEDKLTTPPVTDSTNQLMPVPPVPSPQNVQPTDDDNLEVPTQAPTSKLPQGQKWTWDAANGKFVAMTDPMASPGQTI